MQLALCNDLALQTKPLLTAPRSVSRVDFGEGKTVSAKKSDTKGHHGQ
jgi:hypothetical protein